jgi:phage-related minor tail protein
MSEKVDLGTVYLHVIPSFSGVETSIASEFGAPVEKQASQTGDKAGKKFGAGFKAAAGAGLVAGALAAIKGLYEIGDMFDTVNSTIRVGTGASGEALEGLIDSADNVAKKVPAAYESVATTVADVNTRMGLTGSNLETVSSQFLEAGRILNSEIDISSASAAFNAFKIDSDDTSDALDHLFRVGQATGIEINTLTGIVQKNAPAMQALGFSFEDTALMAGMLDKAGVESNSVMAGMGKGLVKLAKDGEQPAEAYRRVIGEIEGFVESGQEASALALSAELFGTRNAPQMISALNSGALSFDDLGTAAGITGDTILGLGEETMKFSDRLQIFENTASAAFEPLATKVFDALGDALSAAMPHIETFGAWLDKNEWVLGVVAGIIGGALVIGIGLLTAAIWTMTAALFASPITWIIAGVILLGVAIFALVANWDTVIGFLSNIWNGFIGWITDGLTAFGEGWTSFWDGVGEKISEVWQGIIDWITGIWNGIVALFLAIHPVGIIISHWDQIWAATVSVWNAVTGFIGAIWNNIIEAVSIGVDGVLNFFTSMGERITGAITGLANNAYSWGSDIINGLLNGLRAMGGKIASFFGDLLPSWVTDSFSAALGINSPSRVFMELGGHTADGFVLGAEAKREVIARSMRTMVAVPDVAATSISPSVQAAAPAAGDSYEIHPSADMDETLLAEKISRVNNRKKRH